MTYPLAQAILLGAEIYAGVGLIIAVGIVLWGLGRLDPVAAHGTWGFRLLILPGLTALWPLMLARVISGAGHPPVERTAHRRAAAARSRRA